MPTADDRSPTTCGPAGSRVERQRGDRVKRHGQHYTPPELARFVAGCALAQLDPYAPLAVLDPACGDGELLRALAHLAAPKQLTGMAFTGFDRDEAALATARRSLAGLPLASLSLCRADFLAAAGAGEWQSHAGAALDPCARYDLVVANPPYVRTQVLGAASARALAATYGLAGRVDLSHAFVRAITGRLRQGGVLALICSNRFLSTQAGATLRALFRAEYELLDLIDLGDTKLFAAAVLPAVLIARRRTGGAVWSPRFRRVYETPAADGAASPAFASVLDAVSSGHDGAFSVNGTPYTLETGTVATPSTPGEPWLLTTPQSDRWLATVQRHTERTFADIAPIRVGIKTTADPVFIRRDWSALPAELLPEPVLLHPLITHHHQGRWLIAPERLTHRVLYPYDRGQARRTPVPLEDYPRARAYLEGHRERLAARRYLREGGRAWYEIWVPQQPDGWAKPKLVFPDISETPRFALDRSGAIVNGDCYWMPLPDDLPPELLHLMLAVANSSVALRFYDAVCGNRLYASRRRFMTQYVRRFPIPNPHGHAARAIASLTPRLLDAVVAAATPEAIAALEQELDALVRQAFGLDRD